MASGPSLLLLRVRLHAPLLYQQLLAPMQYGSLAAQGLSVQPAKAFALLARPAQVLWQHAAATYSGVQPSRPCAHRTALQQSLLLLVQMLRGQHAVAGPLYLLARAAAQVVQLEPSPWQHVAATVSGPSLRLQTASSPAPRLYPWQLLHPLLGPPVAVQQLSEQLVRAAVLLQPLALDPLHNVHRMARGP
jgi:hypothetical protein